LLANPELTKTDAIKKSGVSRETVYRWLKDPDFIHKINQKIVTYAGAEASEVWKSLIYQCKQGNVKAIKLYFEMIGEYQQTYKLINDTKVEIEFVEPEQKAIETTAKEVENE